MLCFIFFLYRVEILQRYFEVSPKLLGLSWCLESDMWWLGFVGFTKYGDKRINDVDLPLCGWSRILALGNCMYADLHAPRFPYVLIIYFSLVRLFAPLFLLLYFHMYKCQKPCHCLHAALFISEWAHSWCHHRCAVFSYAQDPDENISVPHIPLEKVMPWTHFPFVVFHMYKPESNFNSRQQRKFTVAAHKKRKFLRSLLHLMAWSGPTNLKFKHGLLEVCTEGKPACQCSKTWSVPAMVNSLFGRLLWFCSGFVHMEMQHARVPASNMLFPSLFRWLMHR